jgi:hypothetical protein
MKDFNECLEDKKNSIVYNQYILWHIVPNSLTNKILKKN